MHGLWCVQKLLIFMTRAHSFPR